MSLNRGRRTGVCARHGNGELARKNQDGGTARSEGHITVSPDIRHAAGPFHLYAFSSSPFPFFPDGPFSQVTK